MRILKVLVIFAFVGIFLGTAYAEGGSGKILIIQGNVEVKLGSGGWMPAVQEMKLSQGDMIRTAANSLATIDVENAGFVEIKPNSELELSELTSDQKNDSYRTILDLSSGEVLIKAKKLSVEKSKFEVKTPTSVVGVRGTSFSVKVDTVTE